MGGQNSAQVIGARISNSYPNKRYAPASHTRKKREILILTDNCEPAPFREIPYFVVLCFTQAKLRYMLGFATRLGESSNESRRQLSVDEKTHLTLLE